GVITFYHDFRREPAGRHVVKICRAESCQSMNGEALCNHAKASLKLGFGETTDDGQVTLDAVYCLGNCALSPAMMVDGELHGRIDAGRFDEILRETLSETAQCRGSSFPMMPPPSPWAPTRSRPPSKPRPTSESSRSTSSAMARVACSGSSRSSKSKRRMAAWL